MPLNLMALMVLSVALSSSAQLLLKSGMTNPHVQAAIAGNGGFVKIFLAVAFSPFILGGLAVFGLSVILWLGVLSKVDVSQAYPAVALGIAVTAIGGHVLFGEQVSAMRIAGIAVIAIGILLVAKS